MQVIDDSDAADPSRRTAARFAVTSAAGLALVLAGGLAAVALLWAAAGPIVALDEALAGAANAAVAPRPWLVGLLEAVTTLGTTAFGAGVVALLAVVLLVRGRRGPALFAVVTGLGALALVPALKVLVGRLRPVVEAPVSTAGGPSFPSGHTTTVTVWVGVLLLALLPALAPRFRRPAIVVGALVVLAVGLTRVALGVHFLTDVVAGWLLGAAWLAVTALAFRAGPGERGAPWRDGLDPAAAGALAPAPASTPPDRRRTVAARLLVVAVALLGVMLALGQLVTHGLADTPLAAADTGAVRAVEALRTPALDALSGPAAELGNTGVVVLLGLVAVVLALAVLRRWRPAVLLTAAIVGETLLFMATASITGRERPDVRPLDAQLPPTSSFPSGHTAAAVALYGGVAVVVLGATRAWWRWLVLATAVAAVVLVAGARLYRGAHHPSDVLGSLVLAVPWLYALQRLLPGPAAPDRPVTD
ncbi:MAG: phosphatase PAP2 family protein [Pseudonocardiales bacterium]|nr:phosphatase PAP2 family protein [Pseudonocardiales bacterium]